MDSPRLTGAYRFELHPDTRTRMAVRAEIYVREEGGKLGLAPLTSMYLFGENQNAPHPDYRPEVHDSDGLSVQTDQEWLWRPLVNPQRLQVTSFAAKQLKGFGLMQRDRAFQLGRLPPVVCVGVNAGGRRPQAGEQTRARRIATRRGTVSLGEEQAAPGQAIHVRRPRLRMPTKHAYPVIEIVNSNEQHIWPGHTLSRLANRQRQQGDQET